MANKYGADMLLISDKYCANCGKYLRKKKKIKIGGGIYLCEQCYKESYE